MNTMRLSDNLSLSMLDVYSLKKQKRPIIRLSLRVAAKLQQDAKRGI